MTRVVALAAALALAVGGGLPAAAQGDVVPLEITAEKGLEWRRSENSLLAQGSVVVTRGPTRLEAESVNAYYRKADEGGSEEIYRVDASGNVRISSEDALAYGDSAAYDLDQSVFVLTGGTPRFEATNVTVRAMQNLEYWQSKQLAVARGGAVATSGDRRIAADVLSAFVARDRSGKTLLRKVEAFGGVLITTADDRASGDEAVYDAAKGIATLCGNVEIRRGENTLRGKCAEVDLNTGVSRLIGGGGGVRGLVTPDN